MEDLGTLPGDGRSEAFAINSRGEAVGYSGTLGRTRAFRWTKSAGIQDLGTLPGGNYSRALSINDRSEVVGSSDSSVGSRAFLWAPNRGMQDLNTMIPESNDFVLFEAVSVNNLGMILALGSDTAGHTTHDHGDHESPYRVLLLIPEP
jgi:probable HAF family extracellular repeat protein